MQAPLYLLSMGAASPIGRTVWSSAAGARAGLCSFREHPFMVDTAGEPMRVAAAPWLDVGLRGAARLVALLFPAIKEALQPVAAHLDQLRLPLLLALPPPRPGGEDDLPARMRAAVAERWGARLDPVRLFPCGHAGGLLALDAAAAIVAAGEARGCVVAGVDSYLAPETLEWLEACDQLHGAGPENNAWGFVPGEAAGALLVAGRAAASRSADVFAAVTGLSVARETKLIKTNAVCIGEGLTQAFRAALSCVPQDERVDMIFCDQNGEKYRADEYGFASLRTRERFRSVGDFRAPADCWGDIGAAGALVHATLAVISHRKRYAKGPLSLVCASSEGGERGAAVLRAQDERTA